MAADLQGHRYSSETRANLIEQKTSFLIFYFLLAFSCLSHDQDHRPELSKCLVALSLRPIWVFLEPMCFWLCGENFLTCLTILPANDFKVLK